MKNLTSAMAFFMLACFVIGSVGCDKDDDNGNGLAGFHMTAKIDGRSWESAQDQLILVDNQQGYLFISGAVDDDLEIMTIQLFDFPGGKGTYPLGTGVHEDWCFYTSAEDITYVVFSDEEDTFGILEITSYESDHIRGIFSFTAMDATGEEIIQVTDGSFHMPNFDLPK